MIYGAILGGGIGKRMGISTIPKQFLDLAGKPIIIHTIEKFLVSRCIDVLFVAVPREWLLYCRDIVDNHIKIKHTPICIVEGGGTRNESIFNIIGEIENKYGVKSNDVIMTHDAVRPFVPMRVIEENAVFVHETGACDTVIAATDTIIESFDGVLIKNIPDRKHLYQGQTPQTFYIDLLSDAYDKLSNEEKSGLTDACGICVMRGIPVRLVEGSVLNIKITTQEDLKIAESLINLIQE